MIVAWTRVIAVEVVRSGQILDQDRDMELYNTERWREVEEPAIEDK